MMCIVVFLSVAALDFVWARYTKCINENRAIAAGIYAAIIIILGGTAVIGYTSDPWLLIPAGAGAFVGTYGAVWWAGK